MCILVLLRCLVHVVDGVPVVWFWRQGLAVLRGVVWTSRVRATLGRLCYLQRRHVNRVQPTISTRLPRA